MENKDKHIEQRNRTKLIVLTGPESTGKSTLSKQLARHLNGCQFPEYARTYLEERQQTTYAYEDVESVAKGQLLQYAEAQNCGANYAFLDTWLIITKVWFQWVYAQEPLWLEEEIQSNPIDLYLLCKPDLPWVADHLRENGGNARSFLYEEYKKELTNRGCPFVEISGTHNERLANAIKAVKLVP
ncbi:MAG: AAA family ATPase [Mangrovibacterium sp.]